LPNKTKNYSTQNQNILETKHTLSSFLIDSGYMHLLLAFFRLIQYNVDIHNTHAPHARTLIPLNTRTQTVPYKQSADLEIHEVTTDASLSTGTSPTTKNIALLNPEINPGKYDHPCQVENLKPGGQVSPQGTQQADL
jgi:hypothetical protein